MEAKPAPTSTSDQRRARRGRSLAAVAVGLVALTACTSDPGPQRVARDIIETESQVNPDLDEACLLERLDEFSDDQLNAISEQVRSGSAATQEEGQTALAEFRSALESCL